MPSMTKNSRTTRPFSGMYDARIPGHGAARADELQPEPARRARRAAQPTQRGGGSQACARDAVGDEPFAVGVAPAAGRSAARALRSGDGSDPARRSFGR